MDGLKAGHIIYEKNPDCRIIMATSNDKRYGEAFNGKTAIEIAEFEFCITQYYH